MISPLFYWEGSFVPLFIGWERPGLGFSFFWEAFFCATGCQWHSGLPAASSKLTPPATSGWGCYCLPCPCWAPYGCVGWRGGPIQVWGCLSPCAIVSLCVIWFQSCVFFAGYICIRSLALAPTLSHCGLAKCLQCRPTDLYSSFVFIWIAGNQIQVFQSSFQPYCWDPMGIGWKQDCKKKKSRKYQCFHHFPNSYPPQSNN